MPTPPASRQRLFAGHRAKALRKRLSISQAEMARRLDISVSYLSQIENDDRPLTGLVLAALARAFPFEWSELDPGDDSTLMMEALDAATDPVVAENLIEEEALLRAVRQQPLLARRMVALHAAFRRSQEQVAILDDTVESGATEGVRMPWEIVRDWFHSAGNYIDVIDRRAEILAEEIAPGGAPNRADIERRLYDRHGVRVIHPPRGAGPQPLRRFIAADRILTVDRSQPPESQLFLVALQLMRLEGADALAHVIGGAQLRSEEATRLLEEGLVNYAAGALLMPYALFRRDARETRHDIDRLRLRFGASFEQACHRLSTLQRPGMLGIPFYFCRVDMAGNITKRHSATRLQFARFGGACPLWVVHEAVAIPDRIAVQLAETPDGTRYISMAKGLVKPTGSYARPPRRYAVALGCEVEHAADFIYGDQLDFRAPGSATPIGVSCRTCPRHDCEQRAFPPAGRPLIVDADERTVVPYSFS